MTSETSVTDNRAQDGVISWPPLRREVVGLSYALLPGLAFEQKMTVRGKSGMMWALRSLVAQ